MWRLGVVTASVGLVSPARAWREERGRGRPAGQRERGVLRIAMFGGAGDDDLTILNSSTVQERTSLEGDEGSNHLSTRCADLAEGTISPAIAAPTCCGPARDTAAGGHGPDTIYARDGQRDSLSGGPGKTDRARIDRGLDHVTYMEELV